MEPTAPSEPINLLDSATSESNGAADHAEAANAASDSDQTRQLEATANALRARLDATNRAREEALRLSREVIQYSSRAIRAMHRRETPAARALVLEARTRVMAVRAALANHPELYFAGYVHDSQKEYVEAEAMVAIVTLAPLPAPDSLNVEPAAYLNGMAEAASESRRHVLDLLRTGNLAQAERVLKVMDDIYFELVTFDFPDAITGGLRRTTDALRAVLERTRADLTITLSQYRLETALNRVLKRPDSAALLANIVVAAENIPLLNALSSED